jgi:4-carboxymuconolactone decarboxylase
MSAGNGDRLPLPATLTPAQQHAVQSIVAGPRGGLFGPFVPLLRAPELMTRLQLVGEYLRFESTVPPELRELAILLVARTWDQDFEWGHHVGIARDAGVDEAVIAAVAHRGQPTGGAPVETVWRLVDELISAHTVGDDTYAAALGLLGEQALVEMVATVGYYTTLAMTMNAARTPAPEDYERLP